MNHQEGVHVAVGHHSLWLFVRPYNKRTLGIHVPPVQPIPASQIGASHSLLLQDRSQGKAMAGLRAVVANVLEVVFPALYSDWLQGLALEPLDCWCNLLRKPSVELGRL